MTHKAVHCLIYALKRDGIFVLKTLEKQSSVILNLIFLRYVSPEALQFFHPFAFHFTNQRN